MERLLSETVVSVAVLVFPPVRAEQYHYREYVMENVVIAGSGPAGLTAAIYTARAGLAPLVVEGFSPGGQLTVTTAVENFPGLLDPVSGFDLMETFRLQAERFGVRFQRGTIESVEKSGKGFILHTDEADILAKALVIATGAEARRLSVMGEPKFYGRGVSGCATCDGPFFRGKHVLVVGGGNTAIEDAVYLSTVASQVTIVHRRNEFRADHIELERARKIPSIKWKTPWVIDEITGDKIVEGAILRNTKTGETERIDCAGIFVAIGHTPKTAPFANLVLLDSEGYIQVQQKTTETTTPGVFACGDVCDPVYQQAVVAAGQGCMAAFDVQKYLRKEQ